MSIRETVLIGDEANAPRPVHRRADNTATEHSFYRRHGKRALDVAFTLLSLPIILPLFVVLYFVVRRDGGPFLFAHPRVGQNGKVYGCLKIRTMVVDAHERLQEIIETDPVRAEEWRTHFKLRDDPRITTVGRVLRATSFDELPQIFNILRGEMSVVGPRPITDPELELYGDAEVAYKSLRPGLTGAWQIAGRRENDFSSRATSDEDYARNVTLGRDLAIILKTVPEVLRAHGR